MEPIRSPCALISLSGFSLYMEKVEVHAPTRANLFLLETEVLAVETLPLPRPLLSLKEFPVGCQH